MKGRKHVKMLREGDYYAEVDVELLEDPDGSGWGPYLSLADALVLDDIRRALRTGNIAEAMKRARVYRILPIPAA